MSKYQFVFVFILIVLVSNTFAANETLVEYCTYCNNATTECSGETKCNSYVPGQCTEYQNPCNGKILGGTVMSQEGSRYYALFYEDVNCSTGALIRLNYTCNACYVDDGAYFPCPPSEAQILLVSLPVLLLILFNIFIIAFCILFVIDLGDSTITVKKTLLYVNYESGRLDDRIPNLESTNSNASDAAYIVSPGRNGMYAIGHKVTLGDPGYYSDGSYRSESATHRIRPGGRFVRGDNRRYEVSLLLKDWQEWKPGMSSSGDIIFQGGKLAGGGNPAYFIATKRNSLIFRMPNNNETLLLLDDFRPYSNQWFDFRIDVAWRDSPTGLYIIYMRIPSIEKDYKLIKEYKNYHTYLPDNPKSVMGYSKWGLYRPGQSLENGDIPTRIIYHDDICIFDIDI
ncbi:hypothetical protein DLAC_07550 [Tieghemostelium lacteum]|uniref:Carbohydrate binding domain-containing protein n=1 Tax=Tieghemostelium lacteum TaxID=361077 RepID=A0A151ZCT0_TIELA|nr:hypothetical protein DLAC_07550 [Tieghemostelium lacteum]|eukprot:KYQ91762.1 hypothetical protein DLAC_07550 [Tieghemostelium lacteum]